MNESAENFGISDKRLSLIDVSFEDDSLYSSSSPNHRQILQSSGNRPELKSVRFLGVLEDNSSNEETSKDSFEDGEKVLKPLESLESENVKKTGKYNLRKSLAWDSAFFTSAGVLEPEELSSMIGDEKGSKSRLPGIEEDVSRSNDSISTLASDGLALETLEADLFGDIRASIQKSIKVSNVVSSSSEGVCGVTESQPRQSTETLDNASGNKSKARATPKKLKTVLQVPEKINKQSVVGNNGESKPLCKPPTVAGRISPILTAATKRASLGANHLKVERDIAKNSFGNPAANRGAKIPSLSGSRNTVPRPMPPSKCSSGSSIATKMTTSSIDGSGSLSSGSSGKSSLTSVRKKADSRTSSGLTGKNGSRVTPKNKNQLMSSRLSPYLKPMTKLSSSISPASSISEWSSGSLSPTSTLNKGPSSSRSSIDTNSCRDASGDGILDSQDRSNGKCSVRNGARMGLPVDCAKRASIGSATLLQPDSIKPSGLRMPSPKIGFFDGAKSSVGTPNGSMQSHAVLSSGLPRAGAGSISPSGGSTGAKLGKLQPLRTVTGVRGAKIGIQQPALGIKPKFPSPLQEPSNTASKVSGTLRTAKRHPGSSPKVQSRMPPKNDGESSMKTEKVASKEYNVGMGDTDSGFAERNGNPCLMKHEMNSETGRNVSIKDGVITPISGLTDPTNNSSITSEVENMISLQNEGEHAIGSQNYVTNSLCSLNGSDDKEKDYFEGELDGLTRQVGSLDIQRKIAEESSVAQEEFLNLSKSTFSSKPTTGPTVVEIEKTGAITHPMSILGRAKDGAAD